MTEQEVLGIIRKERQSGGGCSCVSALFVLVLYVFFGFILVFFVGVEFRLRDLEDKTGLDHSHDIFDRQSWERLGPRNKE